MTEEIQTSRWVWQEDRFVPAAEAKPSRKRRGFTMFPDEWDHQLARVRADGSVYRVAIHLLREARWSGSNRVKLANGVLEQRGVSRWRKYRALDELCRLGLISIERRPHKAPTVTVKFTD